MARITVNIPDGWGDDALTGFIDHARGNMFASFVNTPQHYQKLLHVDDAFRRVLENLKDPEDFFAPLFLLKAHSSFRAAAGLGMAGQSPEAFMCMRGALESALYGMFIHKNDGALEIWLKRNESEDAKAQVRKAFTVSAMWKCLKSVDAALQEQASDLYDKTIDFGAHPNSASMISALKLSKGEKSSTFQLAYLSAEPLILRGTMKSVAQTGVISLLVFQHVLPKRYDDVGVSDLLAGLRKDL